MLDQPNPIDLPFDADEMLAGLRPWIECESPTWDAEAVNRMLDLAARDLAAMGARIDRIPGAREPSGVMMGGMVRAELPHPRAGEPGIVIMGHFDTVHPVGTLEVNPFRREDDKCWGPGICDMKGGNYLALEALRQLARAGIETPLPVRILFTPDEEIGSPTSRALIEAEAARAKYVLVPEPGLQGGGVTSGRYAIARFNLRTRGKPSHAGARLSEGRSAIREMCRRVLQIEEMTSDACTFSVGVFHAGQWVNCVSSEARAEALSMAKRQEDLDRGVQAMLGLSDAEAGFEVTRGLTRPVWEPSEATLALAARVERLHKAVGLGYSHKSQGGGSDGNFTGAIGTPTIDGLGVEGDGIHTLDEHIDIPTLVARARVFAGLLAELD
jgi:glutamate carboxypeptidase